MLKQSLPDNSRNMLYHLNLLANLYILNGIIICEFKGSVTVRGVGMFMRLFEKSYKV